MVTKRKVTKKKTAAGAKATTIPRTRASSSAPKKKGVAAKRKPAASSGIFSLGEAIVISNVMEWRDKMVAAITNQDEIILDGGEIEQIDGTGLQLLVALMRDAARGGINITWKSASDVLRQNAAQLGLTEILSLDKLLGTG